MNDTKHTPGPWKIESEPFNVWDKFGLLICHCNVPLEPDTEYQKGCANARLIAAAPELLSACTQVAAWLQVSDSNEEPMSITSVRRSLRHLQNAIAKAEDGRACVARRDSDSPLSPTEKDEAMRLCAAAPNLFRTLRALLDCEDLLFIDGFAIETIEAIEQARAAIAKAEGKPAITGTPAEDVARGVCKNDAVFEEDTK